ncbi:MAG: hypothetical protein J6S83_11730 [Lachnospiraceae bacterium]|nr:hypothetical protein [Lachnospiraceae bacterium]
MSKYIKKERQGSIIFIVVIILAIIIGLAWNYLESGEAEGQKPDAVYPMANAHISWEQTFHGGAWNE